MTEQDTSIPAIFSAGGILARNLTGYETRTGQAEMAVAVADLLDIDEQSEEHGPAACLVVEAETGLGKTLAYLVPAALSGRRVVISTNTRNLQDQILERELPLIHRLIDPELRAMCIKGRQNYLCLHRWHQYRSARQDMLFDDKLVGRIDDWLKETVYAERSELPWLSTASPVWQRINSQSHLCLGNDCLHASHCHLNRLRQDAATCRLLIVNHHLLFADLAVRRSGHGEVLPRYEAVIFDEAHHVENVATTFFGQSFSRYQLLDLLHDMERSALADLGASAQQKVQQQTAELAGLLERFIALFPANPGRHHLSPILTENQEVASLAATMAAAIRTLGELSRSLRGAEPWEQYELRTIDLAERLELITTEEFTDMDEAEARHTRWYERTGKRANLTLSLTPIEVQEYLQETLFDKLRACVFTSATLSAAGKFNYFLSRLGLPEETVQLRFPSPFDYRNRSLIYLPPSNFPEPNAPSAVQALHEQMKKLIDLAGGRTLGLFTSFSAMDKAAAALADSLHYPLLVQGEMPRKQLLDRFITEENSVLFGVASFWEGVDVPGPALRLVIIDKLPFEVPSDPVIMARINKMKAAGGNPFFDFQVPRAILGMRQGVGRLMRTSTDLGVIALMDVRLRTKGYGRRFLQSLPPAPVCQTLAEVAQFFKHHA
ncbi:MAG: ATP-dependent helicase [Desulfobulbus propionicus]|nr:MAG: ATP-dependent helicase [Desulfobulbus propionicus]